MSGFVDKLEVLHQFLSKLTWGKIAQLIALFLVLFSAWLTFETRNSISKFILTGSFEKSLPLKPLSKKTIDDLELTVSKIDVISAISIDTIDFKTNTRMVVYVATSNSELKSIVGSHQNLILSQPLFTNNAEQNARVVELINGDFVCSKFKSTFNGIEVPETIKYIDTVCANSIPPFYGKIVGTISIFLKRSPSLDEIDQVRVLSKNLSATIYNNELR